MATNQRENARKEKQLKKERKVKTIIWCVLIALIVILIGMKLAEVDYNQLSNKIFGSISSQSSVLGDSTITTDSSKNVQMVSVNGKLNVLCDTSYSVYEPSTGEILYNFVHGYANPCMSYAGNYTCVYDQGGKKLRLDTNSDSVYESSFDNSILCADVSKNGSIIYATTSENAKSTVSLVNRSLKKLLHYDVYDGYVVAVAVDAAGKKCAFATVNSKGADFVTTVYTINSGDSQPISTFEYVNTSVINLNFSSSNLFVVCDNNVYVIKNQEKSVPVFENTSLLAVNHTYTTENQLVFVFADYANSNENKVAYINKNGKIKNQFTVSNQINYIYCDSKDIVVYTDDITAYSLSKGEKQFTVKCDSSVNSFVKLASKLYIQHQQVIDSTDV